MRFPSLKTLACPALVLCLLCLPGGRSAQGDPPREALAAGEHTRVLSPGDTVQVTVYQDPALNTKQRVSTDGTIAMLYIGSVPVGGTTTTAAAAKIADLLYKGQYIRNAQVRVAVDEYVKQVVTVGGQVNRPGPVPVPSERTMDLQEAIASAGGETQMADLGNVTVRRSTGGGNSTEKVNLKALSKANRVYTVQPGDVITVGMRIF